MQIDVGGINLNVRVDGDPDGPPVVFANSLGTNLHMWDLIMPHLPDGLRIIRFDKRGHGTSDVPPAPYSMGALISDAEKILDELQVRDCLFVGLSIGGLIAQGLATKRLDQIRAMVLSNTGAKIGTTQIWDDRIAQVKSDGLESMADVVMKRWFSKSYCESPKITQWRDMLVATPDEGYAGCSAAISGTDFYTQTAALTLPTLGIAGSEDGATPPDLVRETTGLIKGSRFELIRGAGHLPCVEKPEEYAGLLKEFIAETGHL